ncbi:MAG: IS21 family transposase [Gemmatimonadetes bacterium]|nr:IS21 family transposase [Gemmatimonadota bacterium]
METWSEIRRLVLAEGHSKRSVCRRFGIHWDTLNKILGHAGPPGYRQTQRRPRPRIGPHLAIIDRILIEDRGVHRKQRHTAKRIFDRLREEHGYAGGYTAVKDAVRAWRCRHAEVFVPLKHPPGEAQVDFGTAEVILDGVPIKAALFVMTLPYSDAIFCCLYPRECTEAFLDGHRRAFGFFGGVPRRISYDNTRIAVRKVMAGRQRALTDAFLRLQSHYLFRHHFCRVGRANEKGHVENLLGFARRNFLVPIPRVDSLESLNRQLEADCRKDLQRTLRGKPGPKRQLLDEEREHFLTLPPEAFEARRVRTAKANSLSLVRFDRNDYSVPTAYAHHDLTVIGGIDRVQILFGVRVVATHPRHWGRQQVLFEPVHYLALLERKPGAFDVARPLEQWRLPDCFAVLRRRLENEWQHAGTREFIKVLRLLESNTLRALTDAVEYALSIGALDRDAVGLILQHRREQPVTLFCLDGRPHLKTVRVRAMDLQGYRILLTGGAA